MPEPLAQAFYFPPDGPAAEQLCGMSGCPSWLSRFPWVSQKMLLGLCSDIAAGDPQTRQ